MTETPENERPDQDAVNDTPDQDAIESPDPSGVAPYEPADSPAVDPAGQAGENPDGAQPAQTPDPNEADLADRPAQGGGQPAEPAGEGAESGTDDPAGATQSAAPETSPAPAAEPTPAPSEQPVPAQQEPTAAPQAGEGEPSPTLAPSPGDQPAATGEPPAQQGPSAGPPAETGVASPEEVYDEPVPRVKPEIPGADLTPDIVPEGAEFLDAEARAAAEADAEAAAAMDPDQAEDSSLPIADAAIDLGAGARYTATGKRKTAVARVILKPGTGSYSINGKALEEFFPRETLQRIIRQPLETVGYESRMDVVARMHGGGVAAQAGALRHGLSRALIVADPNLRGELKRRGFLTRDPRVKERKKAGLKKARKRPQFSKR